jgi:hypothetical protein
MYSLVVLVGMSSSLNGMPCGGGSSFPPCIALVKPTYCACSCYGGFEKCPPALVTLPGLPGGVVPLGSEPSLSDAERDAWEKYVALLPFTDREVVREVWAQASRKRQREMLSEALKLLKGVKDPEKKMSAPLSPEVLETSTSPARPVLTLPDPPPTRLNPSAS